MSDRIVLYLYYPSIRPASHAPNMSAQEITAVRHLATWPGAEIVGRFVEEPGAWLRGWPELNAAIHTARATKATLLIPRLGRLAGIRSPAFVLAQSGVMFVACDRPSATARTLATLVKKAEHEWAAASARARVAVMAARATGKRVGNPDGATARRSATDAKRAAADGFARRVHVIAAPLRAEGLSLREVAEELNRRQLPSPWGRQWRAGTVRRVFERCKCDSGHADGGIVAQASSP